METAVHFGDVAHRCAPPSVRFPVFPQDARGFRRNDAIGRDQAPGIAEDAIVGGGPEVVEVASGEIRDMDVESVCEGREIGRVHVGLVTEA